MSDDRALRCDLPLAVRRTARVAVLGPEGPGVRELWYVLHGYGQLAAPFLEEFRAIDDGTRLIVAPEALSRFYEGDAKSRLHKDARVGASWMTREDREAEIADYLGYLDSRPRLHARAAGGREVAADRHRARLLAGRRDRRTLGRRADA